MNFNDAGRFIPRSNLLVNPMQAMNPGGPNMGGAGGGDPREALIKLASGFTGGSGPDLMMQGAQQGIAHDNYMPQGPQGGWGAIAAGLPQPNTQPGVADALQHSTILQRIKQLLAEGNPNMHRFQPQMGKMEQVDAARRLAAMLAHQYHGTRRQFAGPTGGRFVME